MKKVVTTKTVLVTSYLVDADDIDGMTETEVMEYLSGKTAQYKLGGEPSAVEAEMVVSIEDED